MTQELVRLSEASLGTAATGVLRPDYDRARVTAGIVHLGIGAFHRAHQAVYTDAVLAAGDHRWGIIGASLRSAETRDALVPQDHLYTLSVRAEEERLQVVGSIRAVLVAPEETGSLLAALSRPEVRLVTLTVTEKGYCHRPATGELEEDHPDIRHDLLSPHAPRSAVGFLVEAIRLRRAAGAKPLTLLSCDNLPANGRTLRGVVTRFAALRDPALSHGLEETSFPSSMVDRIVPQTTEPVRASICRALGLDDAWPIATEPFSQWVIEDEFSSGRPEWEVAGATFVRDVAPFELMKLRLLNGSHSLLAYLACPAGLETVSDAIRAPGFEALVRRFMEDEVSPTLPALAGFDLAEYRSSLLQRFANGSLQHRTSQIAMDGSQKLPQRLLGTIRDRLAEGRSIDLLALGVAAWMRYATGRDETGAPIEVRDPLAGRIARATAGARDAEDLAAAYFGLEEVFGSDLPQDGRFRAAVEAALRALLGRGARAVVASLAPSSGG
jgi:fructuronate reductase